MKADWVQKLLMWGLLLISSSVQASPIYCGGNPCTGSCVNLNDIFLAYDGGMYAISSAWSMGNDVSNQLSFEGYSIIQSNILTMTNTICGWDKLKSVNHIGVHRGTLFFQPQNTNKTTTPDGPTVAEIVRVMDSIYPTSSIAMVVCFSLIYGIPILAVLLVILQKIVKVCSKFLCWCFGIINKFTFKPFLDLYRYTRKQIRNRESKRADAKALREALAKAEKDDREKRVARMVAEKRGEKYEEPMSEKDSLSPSPLPIYKRHGSTDGGSSDVGSSQPDSEKTLVEKKETKKEEKKDDKKKDKKEKKDDGKKKDKKEVKKSNSTSSTSSHGTVFLPAYDQISIQSNGTGGIDCDFSCD